MSTIGGANIVKDGLVLCLDAGNQKSYVNGSTVWRDISSNNNSGSLINGPTFSSANGGSIVFDGVDDCINISNPIVLQSQNLSISMWVNPSTATTAIAELIDYDHASSPLQGWVIQSEDATTNRYYYFAYYDGSVFQPGTGIGVGKGVQLVNSIWQNLTYTKSGTSVIGYLNGIQVINYIASNANISYQSNKNLQIAKVVNSSFTRVYTGKNSITSVYNRALSAQEVLQNYEALKSRYI